MNALDMCVTVPGGIKHYSVAYFNCITVFEVLYHRNSITEGGRLMCTG